MQVFFSILARKSSEVAGSAWFFATSVAVIALWLLSGPYMGFNEAWNFWANTTTTIGTWVLVILIQNSQNRDTAAIHQKLDELIRVDRRARDGLIGIERREDVAA